MMLNTKHQGSSSCGFGRDNKRFSKFSPLRFVSGHLTSYAIDWDHLNF